MFKDSDIKWDAENYLIEIVGWEGKWLSNLSSPSGPLHWAGSSTSVRWGLLIIKFSRRKNLGSSSEAKYDSELEKRCPLHFCTGFSFAPAPWETAALRMGDCPSPSMVIIVTDSAEGRASRVWWAQTTEKGRKGRCHMVVDTTQTPFWWPLGINSNTN